MTDNKICKCGNKFIVNKKYCLCSECNYLRLHNGKTQAEIYSERSIERKSKISQVIVTDIPKKKKKGKKSILNEYKLEKTREVIRKDEEFYELIFNTHPNNCAECGIWLPNQFRDDEGRIIARHQYSHILGKGAFPEFRHHPKNCNRLCLIHHHIWEFGEKEKMNIYESNQILIQEMYDERNKKVL
jgi:hypothetical protein